MEEKTESGHKPAPGIDAKIVAAVISGVASIIIALLPSLNADDRSRLLYTLLGLMGALLTAAGLTAAYRKRGFRLFAAAAAAAAVVCAGVFAAWRMVPVRAELSYVKTEVSIYAGSGVRAFRDGTPEECALVSPGSLTAAGEDALYFTDSDRLRCLRNGQILTEAFPYQQYKVKLVRSWNADVYVLTETEMRGPSGTRYYNVFLRLRNGRTEVISEPLEMGAFAGAVADFAFSRGGVLWFIRLYDVPGDASATLERLSYDRDADRYGPPEWVTDLPYEAPDMRNACMAFDGNDNLYLSAPGQRVILRWAQGEQECRVFAGTPGEQAFNDREPFAFSWPTSLAADGGYLYVLDNGVVRRITVDGDRAVKSETLAGVDPEKSNAAETRVHPAGLGDTVAGEEVAFPGDERAALAIDGRGRLILSDPVNGFLYQIREI